MKKLFTLSLTMSLFIFLLSSCEKESIIAPTPYEFEGEWEWVKTTSGWSAPLYPDSIGHSISLRIDHITYTMLVDNVVSEQWSYEYKTEVNHFGTPIESLLLENGKQHYITTVDSVKLVLNDGLYDSSVWHYARK